MKKNFLKVVSIILVVCLLLGYDIGTSQAASNVNITEISCDAGAMVKGNTKSFKALDASGKKVSGVKWKTSNSKIATISKAGKLKAKKNGTVTVTASKGKSKATIKLTIFKPNAKLLVNKKVNGKKGLYYMQNKKVIKKTGFVSDGIKYYYIKNGKVDVKKTGLVNGKLGKKKSCWYVKKGVVLTDFSGVMKSGKKKLFIDEGEYNKSFSGVKTSNGITYKVKNGQVVKSAKGEFDVFNGDTFTLKEGKSVKLQEGITFKLNAFYPVTSYCEFTMKVDGMSITGYVQKDEAGKPRAFLNKFYKIFPMVESIENGNITFSMKKVDNIMKPMDISGSAKDTYTTNGYTYIMSEHFIIYLPPNVTFPGNILTMYERLKTEVEKEFPLSKKVSSYKHTYGNVLWDLRSYYTDTDGYLGVDPGNRIPIYVSKLPDIQVAATTIASIDSYGSINIAEDCLDVNKGQAYVLAHEYAHYLHLINCPPAPRVFTEGYADYLADVVMNNNKDIYYFDSDGYYVCDTLEKLIIESSDIETLFKDICDNKYPGLDYEYEFGCVLFKYIEANYGTEAITNILKDTIKRGKHNQYLPNEYDALDYDTVISIFKDNTSPTILKDFQNSFKINIKE